MQDHTTPLDWFTRVLTALQWPALIGFAFYCGKLYQEAVTRANKAEANVTALVERHMPAIHRALAEIRGLLMGRGK